MQNPYEFRQDPVLVLILGILTCGLYLIYWNYKAAEAINAELGREAISPAIAILGGCCTPVNLYFYYLTGKEAQPVIQRNAGREPEDQTVMLMVLGFFFPMVSAMIVQGDLNRMYDYRAASR
jgi:hypothetical protein